MWVLFDSQKQLNSHVSGVHSLHLLCKKRTCGKEFSSKVALVKHGLCHQLPHYRCTLCGSRFQFQYQLKDYGSTHTNLKIKCRYPRCRRVYKSESEYKRHYKVHTTEFQEYTCTTFGKSCSTKKNLDKHMALHSDILRFQCESCGKKSRWCSSLSIHMRCKHPLPLPLLQIVVANPLVLNFKYQNLEK